MKQYTYEEIVKLEAKVERDEEKLESINRSLQILETIMARFNEIANLSPEEE